MAMNDLWVIHVEQVRRGTVTDQDIDKARRHWMYHDKPDPDPIPASEIFCSFINWFLRFYLRGLIPAFLLFFIWKCSLKKEVAPISFLISLACWPIILGIDIYNKFQETLRRVDVVSRRTKLLTLFSKQEEQLFNLGKNMSRREFRKHLDSIGMTQNHSFASALLATLFLIIVPVSTFSQSSSLSHSKEKVIMIKTDYGGGVYHHVVVQHAVVTIVDEYKEFASSVEMIFFIKDVLYNYLFVPDIGKIPLGLNRYHAETI